MIILIGGTKGGTGKSTVVTNLATYLAHEGKRVMVMDTDKQGSSAKWAERRESRAEDGKNEVPKVWRQQSSGNVYQAALDLDQLYDYVLIDAGGVDSRELRTAMVAADRLYVPLQASQFDLETLVDLNEIIVMAQDQNPGLKVTAVVTRAPSNPLNNEVQEARDLLAAFPLFGVCDTVIRERKAYRDVTPGGLGVIEFSNSQAKAEIQLLAQEIFDNDEANTETKLLKEEASQ